MEDIWQLQTFALYAGNPPDLPKVYHGYHLVYTVDMLQRLQLCAATKSHAAALSQDQSHALFVQSAGIQCSCKEMLRLVCMS